MTKKSTTAAQSWTTEIFQRANDTVLQIKRDGDVIGSLVFTADQEEEIKLWQRTVKNLNANPT